MNQNRNRDRDRDQGRGRGRNRNQMGHTCKQEQKYLHRHFTRPENLLANVRFLCQNFEFGIDTLQCLYFQIF